MTEEGLCGKSVFKNRNFGRKLNLLLYHMLKWISELKIRPTKQNIDKLKKKCISKLRRKKKRWVDFIK